MRELIERDGARGFVLSRRFISPKHWLLARPSSGFGCSRGHLPKPAALILRQIWMGSHGKLSL